MSECTKIVVKKEDSPQMGAAISGCKRIEMACYISEPIDELGYLELRIPNPDLSGAIFLLDHQIPKSFSVNIMQDGQTQKAKAIVLSRCCDWETLEWQLGVQIVDCDSNPSGTLNEY